MIASANTPPSNEFSSSSCSAWVQRFASLIPHNQGPVLDLACGSGRHTRLLLDAGYEVWALDKDASLLEPLAQSGACIFHADLEAAPEPLTSLPPSVSPSEPHSSPLNCYWPFTPGSFAGIVVCNYLHRPLFPFLKSALSNNGILIYETFCEGNAAFGRPRNPDFLLRAGELLQQLESDPQSGQQNHVIAYEHGYVENPRPAMMQRICVRSVSTLGNLPSIEPLERI